MMQKKQYVRADAQVIVLLSSDVVTTSQNEGLPDNLLEIDVFDSNPKF